MQNPSTQGIIIFIAGISFLLLLFISFIVTIVYKYQQKQNAHFKDIETLKTSHENTLLQSQLEIQEQTFQNISREIHDNIGQKLTLAKLHLNTLVYDDKNKTAAQVNDSINIIGEAINDLSDLSHSMSSEIILNNGLIKALEYEENQLKRSGLYEIHFTTTGNPIYLESSTELVLFRIVQEVLNNIVKHAAASSIKMHVHYNEAYLSIEIHDNGKGFNVAEHIQGTGVQNIKKRTALLNGNLEINSNKHTGTEIKIKIPLYENKPVV
ncbi:MAG: sensor histidine kinase [Ferruginibacter sp.]